MIAREQQFEGGAFGLGLGVVVAAPVLGVLWPLMDGKAVTYTPAWLFIGASIVAVLLSEALLRNSRETRWVFVVTLIAAAVCVVAGVTLAVVTQQKYLLVVAVGEAVMVAPWLDGPRQRIILAALSIGLFVAWVFTARFPYTHLSDSLISATGSTALVLPAFVLGLAFALFFLFAKSSEKPRYLRITIIQFCIAAVIFLALGLRVDNEAAVWIPYHQSYYMGPADLVRTGHWLLWDIPSQYGFLSILAVALVPGVSTFDSLYYLTALMLLGQALMVYIVLAFVGRGWIRWLFSILLVLSVFYASQAANYPFGARLYPQEGLRFVWPIALVFCAFLGYALENALHRKIVAIGIYASWLLSLLWSFETGAWATVIIIAYIVGEAAGEWMSDVKPSSVIVRLALRMLALLATLSAAVVAIEAYYRVHLGHGPDWRSYAEFSAIYATGPVTAIATDFTGPGWLLVLGLGSLTTLLILAIREHSYRAVPVLCASLAALWAVSSYYAGEPFAQHVNMVAGVVLCCAAVATVVAQRSLSPTISSLLARLSFVPLYVVLVAAFLGSPSHLRQIRFPNHLSGDTASSQLPPISGELLQLERRAAMKPTDYALYPSSTVWVKLSDGIILPLERVGGANRIRHAWLPLSPVGTFNTWLTLPLSRRIVYVERFLDQSASPSGWYITYREGADCSRLSPRLRARKTVRTLNYEASYCVLAPAAKSLSTS